MKLYFLILLSALASGCVGLAFEPWESGSPAWHDEYAKQINGPWWQHPGYIYGHRMVTKER